MAIADDFTFDFVNRLVRHTAGTATYPSVELYSLAQDEADEPANMSILEPASASTPNAFTWVNGWAMSENDHKWLDDGTFSTSGWASNEVCAIPYDASGAGTMFEANDVGETITGTTTTDTGTILWWDERTSAEVGWVYIRPDDPATDLFDNGTEAWTVSNSTAAGDFTAVSASGEAIFANFNTIGSVADNADVFILQGNSGAAGFSKIVNERDGTAGTWWGTGQIDTLIKVKEVGSLINSGLITVAMRRPGSDFTFFTADLSAGGRVAVPLAGKEDVSLTAAEFGYRQIAASADSSGTFNVGDTLDESNDGIARAVVTSVTGTNPNIVIQYYIIDTPLTDFVATDNVGSIEDTGDITSCPAPTNVRAATFSSITYTFGDDTLDLDNGNGARHYDVLIDLNAQVLEEFHARNQYLTRRGSTTSVNGADGEQYFGVGDVRIRCLDADTVGAGVSEGTVVYGSVSGAEGYVTSRDVDGPSSDLFIVLARTKGTFVNTDVLDVTGSPGTATDEIDGTPSSIPKIQNHPFGLFAGGTFFGARGVGISNMAGADGSSYSLIDAYGVTQAPPTLVTVKVTGLEIDDRVAVYRLTGSGQPINKTEYSIDTGGVAQSATTVTVDGAIASDVPTAGRLVIVDVTDNSEHVYRYSSLVAATGVFTLATGVSGTAEGTSSGDTLDDAGIFIAANTKVGDRIRNITTGETGVIVERTSDNRIVTEGLPTGWSNLDTFETNQTTVAYVDADQLYVPLILEVATAAGDVETTLKYSSPIFVSVRGRQGRVIEPFIAPNTVGASGMTQPLIRNLDSIATA